MNRKKIATVAGLLLSLSSLAQTWDIGYPIAAKVTATLDGGTLTISGTGTMRDWVFHFSDITANYTYAPWDSLRSRITTVVIDEGVTKIGNDAFQNCQNLTSVTIPNSMTSIGRQAFLLCHGLTSVTIPPGVTDIGTQAFHFCDGLTAIHVDAGNTLYSSIDGVLYNHNQTELLIYPTGKQGAFTIPNSVTYVDGLAFQGARGLTALTIPADVRRIDFSGWSIFGSPVSITNLSIVPQILFNYSPDDLSRCTLIVPECALSNYQNAFVWNKFGTIKGDASLPCPDVGSVPTFTPCLNIMQMWDDVLSVVMLPEHNGGVEVEACQWLLKDEPIPGETSPYLYIPEPDSGRYTVRLTLKSGETVLSCNYIEPLPPPPPPIVSPPIIIGPPTPPPPPSTEPPPMGDPITDTVVYPNPMKSYVTIENADIAAGDKIKIFSIDGQMVQQFSADKNRTTLNISSLPRGTYILKVNDKQVKVLKN